MVDTPLLSVVIIGRNEGERLERCLHSIQSMRFDGAFETIYVDSNSTDGSPELAYSQGAQVIEVQSQRPCAAKGRNAGWRLARAPYVLFLDGDTELDPDFIGPAIARFADPSIAVVWGERREMFPDRTIFNRVLDIDWITEPGFTPFCGGDSLIRRDALEAVNGFDETLIAGEEPEMCYRMRCRGYRIWHIDRLMTQHDLDMSRWSQYWGRHIRTGYAYAEVAKRYRNAAEPFWSAECRYNQIRGGAYCAVLAGAAIASAAGFAIPAMGATVLLFAGLVGRTALRAGTKSADPMTRILYGLHSHLQHFPILLGQMKYRLHRLRGTRSELIEYKRPAA